MRPTLLKLGGELLENEQKIAAVARAIARATGPLVVVHGGGKEIDAALAAAGIAKRQVDGLRVTDAPTLEIVVSVLAGAINTRFVAAINGAGGMAVGLTGADAGVAPVKKAPAHRATNGELVDLGLVGEPARAAVAGAGVPADLARVHSRDRVHWRREERPAVQRERRHACREPGGADWGPADW